MTIAMADALLTIPEVAIHLRRGRTTAYRLIASGDIPSVDVGGARRVRKSDLEAYMASLVPIQTKREAS